MKTNVNAGKTDGYLENKSNRRNLLKAGIGRLKKVGMRLGGILCAVMILQCFAPVYMECAGYIEYVKYMRRMGCEDHISYAEYTAYADRALCAEYIAYTDHALCAEYTACTEYMPRAEYIAYTNHTPCTEHIACTNYTSCTKYTTCTEYTPYAECTACTGYIPYTKHLPYTAYAAGWTFDRGTEIWTYHQSDTPTNRTEDLKKGWFHDPFDGYWYYFHDDTGHMLYGSQRIAGREYRFTDIRNRDNYFPEDDGFWYYRENGLIPFGALAEETDRDNEKGGASADDSDTDSDTGEKDNTEEIFPNPEESKPDIPEQPDPETPKTDIPEQGNPEPPNPETPDVTETMPEPDTTPEPEPTPNPEPAPEPDPCIVTDAWDEILKHPDIYENCLLEQCEKELLVSGYRVVQEDYGSVSVATDSDVVPVPVSIIGIGADGKGTVTFAAAEICDAFALPMSASPYYCYLRDETFDAFSTGGWKKSLAYAALNGGRYSYAANADSTQTASFPGFRLFYENERGKRREIKPLAVKKESGNGYLFELLYEERDGYGKPEQGYARDRVKSKIWLLSEVELTGEHAGSIAGEGTYYEHAKQVDGTYWLRSAGHASAGAQEGMFITGDGDMQTADTELGLRFAFTVAAAGGMR